ncbi:MAG TPA: hypothetical protein VF229_02375, partial [Burkholderiaceae bacterium]
MTKTGGGSPSMRAARAVIAASVIGVLAASGAQAAPTGDASLPELAYLKQVNEWRPPSDPQLLFLLMARFANAGRQAEGIEFFEALLKRFDAQLDDRQRALYLTALASLRAGHANDVPIYRRIAWVRDTVKMLDDADRLSGGGIFITHWMSGVVRSRLPGFFGERDNAVRELQWCEANAGRAADPGWMREVYLQLAALHRARGGEEAARRYQAMSGLAPGAKPVIFTTPFSEDPITGHAFSARRIREVVPGTVYVLSGY